MVLADSLMVTTLFKGKKRFEVLIFRKIVFFYNKLFILSHK